MAEQHLEFKDTGNPRAKTRMIHIISRRHGDYLGSIKWYGAWRQYCFQPTVENITAWSPDCLIEIADYITKLMTERKG